MFTPVDVLVSEYDRQQHAKDLDELSLTEDDEPGEHQAPVVTPPVGPTLVYVQPPIFI